MKSPDLPQCEAKRLAALLSYEVLDTEPEREFDDLTWLAQEIAGTPVALISLVDAERQWFKSRRGLEFAETPRGDSFCGHAILGTEPLMIEDTHLDQRFADNPFVTGDEKVRFYLGVPIVDSQSNVLGTLCVFDREPRTMTQDVVKQLEIIAGQIAKSIEGRSRLRRAEEADRNKDDFVSVVSHEMRTPLTAIRNALEILQLEAGAQLNTDQHKLIDTARENTERLTRLVSDILDLSKMESGKLELQLEPLDVPALMDEASNTIMPIAEEAGIELETDVEPAARLFGLARGDGDRLVQVLVNFISNALKHSDSGSTIRMRADKRGPWLRFAVSDEGPGIAPDVRDQLFTKFSQQQAADGKQRKGSGLGLAIARAIAEGHGGRIGVDSAPGEGATFWFEIPVGAH